MTCIHALGRTVQTTVPDFRGPHLGAKMSSSSRSSFRPALSSAPAPPVKNKGTYGGLSKFAMGSSRTMQKQGFNDSKSITFGADTVGQGSKEVSQQSLGSSSTMQRTSVTTSNSITFGADSSSSKPAPPPAPTRKWGSNIRVPPSASTITATPSLPSAPLNSGPPPKASARGGGYGLDAELARKQALKYDVGMEQEAQGWIEGVIGEGFHGSSFAESLKDGQILCKLVNEIRPNMIRKIGVSKMPFKQMENISNFLKACRGLGVAEHDLFETVDLYEEKDMGVVVTCIHALGRAVQGIFRGPKLGAKQATKNLRTFQPGQVKDVGMTKLSMGSYGKMERSTMNDTKSINFGAKMAGQSVGGGITKMMEGSSKTMEATKYTDTRSINFGAKASGESVARGVTVQANSGSAAVMERTEVSKSNNITFGADSGKEEVQRMARVLFDYKATEGNELGLKEGTIIIIVDCESDPEGWWKGKDTNGKEGLFPHNYVTSI